MENESWDCLALRVPFAELVVLAWTGAYEALAAVQQRCPTISRRTRAVRTDPCLDHRAGSRVEFLAAGDVSVRRCLWT